MFDEELDDWLKALIDRLKNHGVPTKQIYICTNPEQNDWILDMFRVKTLDEEAQ